jgi:hypothetical protein
MRCRIACYLVEATALGLIKAASRGNLLKDHGLSRQAMLRRFMFKLLNVLLAAAVVCVTQNVACALYASLGEDEASSDALTKNKYLGADTCQPCHTRPEGNKPEFVLLTEFTTWRTEDRHSLAYGALENSTGRKIGKLLANDENFAQKPEAGCLNCHAMNFPNRQGEGFSPRDGVSCDGCHGPSQEWSTPHWSEREAWRRKTPTEKQRLGMRNLRNPATRSALCLSCHLGNVEEGKVVTHAMYAAGHPPLPDVEIASLSKRLPSHWRDLKEVPYLTDTKTPASLKKLYHYDLADFQNTRLAITGSGVALSQQMNLISERSAGSKVTDPKKRWPEMSLAGFAGQQTDDLWPQIAMANLDCYACHHDLKRPSWRQERGYDFRLLDGQAVHGVPGRIQFQPWPLALFQFGLRDLTQDTAIPDSSFNELRSGLTKLYGANNSQPFGDRASVNQASSLLRDWSQKVVRQRFSIAAEKLDQAALQRLLFGLCKLPSNCWPDYGSARQIAAAIQIVFSEWRPEITAEQQNQFRELLKGLSVELDIGPLSGPEASTLARKKLITEQIATLTKRKISTEEELQAALRTPEGANMQIRDFLLGTANGRAPFLDAYEKLLGEQRLASSRAAADYNPERFKEKLSELAKLLPVK